MSRLLIWNPRRVDFKHYIESDIYKWHAKYKNTNKLIAHSAKHGNIDVCNKLLMLNISNANKTVYRNLISGGWIKKLPSYLLDTINGRKIDEIYSLQHKLFSSGLISSQIDVIYMFRKLENMNSEPIYFTTNERGIRIQIYLYKNINYRKQAFITRVRLYNLLKHYYGTGIINSEPDWKEKLEIKYNENLASMDMYE